MKKITLYSISVILLLFSEMLFSQSLVINEIITSNNAVNTDEDGSYQDWIELFNGSNTAINLEGYGLTDNTNLYQWVFPAKTILPGEHLLIWCSDKNRVDPAGPLHTNFKISADGEVITLTNVEGVVVDSYAAVVIPQNYTYGRATDGANSFLIFPEPTPGAANTTQGFSDILEEPVFSVESGFYGNSFSLNLTVSEPGATILYTLDGSEPDPNNLSGTTYQYKNQYPENPGQPMGQLLTNSFRSYTYSTPLLIQDRSSQPNDISAISSSYHFNPAYLPDSPVMKGNVVRAKTIKPGAMPSKTVTKNYFISPQGAAWFSLPVAAVSIDEDLLFDYNQGIYVAGSDFDQWRTNFPTSGLQWHQANYQRGGDEWEIPGNFTYFVNGQEVINQDAGFRIHGGTTTATQSKSLRLYARSEFGKSSFDYNFFSDLEDDSFKRLILRNSGNDFGVTYFLDAFIHRSVGHLNFETQSYQPTVTFLNGEYWGMLNLRERYDKHYFERVFSIEEDELDYIEIAGEIEVKEGDQDHYDAMIDYAANNSLAVPANYDYITTQLDPVNYADYQITEIYVSNLDWVANNVELFRKKTAVYEPNAPYGQDGRWRWILKDTDVAFGMAGSYTHNTLAFATEPNGPAVPNPAWATLLFRKMLENNEFKNYFINRFADLLNTTFLPDRMQAIYDELKADVAPEIGNQIDRWIAMGSLQNWTDNCSAIINFAYQRPLHQRDHIRAEFGIPSNVAATLNVSGDAHGFIKMNTIEITPSTQGVSNNPYPWTGIYFEGIPVTCKAIAKPGYQFSHWAGDVTGSTEQITFIPTGNFTLTAHFVPAVIVAAPEPIYFWVFDSEVPNDAPLTAINSTFEIPAEAVLEFESCLEGYPFDNTHANWRKASMERRNSPTEINYLPEANNSKSFSASGMKGLQIKQPFKNGDFENTLVFTVSTLDYKDIAFAFAAKDEGAAEGIVVDYSVDGGSLWSTSGLSASEFSLTSEYQLFETSFESVTETDNIAELKIRLRFAGDALTADNGDRVTFNNFSVIGIPTALGLAKNHRMQFKLYPNPASDNLHILYEHDGDVIYSIFSIEGKLIKKGRLSDSKINVSDMQQGIYLLQLNVDQDQSILKFIKK